MGEENRGKRFHVYRLDRDGRRAEHLAWVYADTYKEAVEKANLFFREICRFGVEVCKTKGINKLN